MKAFTTPQLQVLVEMPKNLIKEMVFMFKDEISFGAKPLLIKRFNAGDISYSSEAAENEGFIFNLSLSESETALFLGKSRIYIDVKILTFDGKIPETQLCSLKIRPTLFNNEVIFDE